MSRCVLAGTAAGWLLLCGCINQEPIIMESHLSDVELRLSYIRLAYVRCLKEHQGPPRSLAGLKGLLTQMKQHEGAPEDVLTSPRDGKPFEICWGVNPFKEGSTVWVYEKEGSDGSRYVLKGTNPPEQLSDAEFRAAHFPPGHSTAP